MQIYSVDKWDPTVWFQNPHNSLFSNLSTGLFLYRVPFAMKQVRKPASEDSGNHHPKQKEMFVAETGTACAHSSQLNYRSIRLLY